MANSKADVILRNANAITLDIRNQRAITIYIKNSRIYEVNNSDIESRLVGSNTFIIDCQGRSVIPAFHDAHCHIVAFAESMLNIDLGPASVKSIEDIISTIRKVADTTPPGQWIKGGGYDEFYLKEKRHPDRHDLDRATTLHPVKLTHRSGHAHVLNTAGLRMAGITIESEEPDGGLIDREPYSGEPSGLLFGMSRYLSNQIPDISDIELTAAIAHASHKLLGLGITSVQDASPSNNYERWQQFLKWKREGILQQRIFMMFDYNDLAQIKRATPLEGEITCNAVKVILDEVRGYLNPPLEKLMNILQDIHDSGYQAAIHVVEESTVNAAVDSLAYILSRNENRYHRHRLEHCSICTPRTARRIAGLGILVVTNPSFIYNSGERYLSDVPTEQQKHLYAIKTMLKAGIKVAAGSDAPISTPNPFSGIYAAVTRRARTGPVVQAGEAISLVDALNLYTTAAAYSCFQENRLGTISKGKYADILILNTNLSDVKPENIAEIKVETTLMNGRIAYRSA